MALVPLSVNTAHGRALTSLDMPSSACPLIACLPVARWYVPYSG
jgi:hypothetical protein